MANKEKNKKELKSSLKTQESNPGLNDLENKIIDLCNKINEGTEEKKFNIKRIAVLLDIEDITVLENIFMKFEKEKIAVNIGGYVWELL